MRILIAIAAFTISMSLSLADQASLFGQQVLMSGQIRFDNRVGGPNQSKTLYVTGSAPFYLIDSSNGARVKLDTSVVTVGGVGASSLNFLLQTTAGISQQSNCEVSYRIRATDVAQASVRFFAYGQYKTPWVDTDSSWTTQAYLWGQDTVLLSHTPPAPTTAWSTRRWFFMPSGDNMRINIQRVDVGAGDTVAIKMEGRCR